MESTAKVIDPFQTAPAVKFKPAGNNKRVIAFIIDAFISGVLVKLTSFALSAGFHMSASGLVAYTIVSLAFWTLLTVEFGATPGKRIMGLRIVTANHKLKVGFWQIWFRETIGRMLSVLPIFLGYVWPAIDKKDRKTFHDMLSKTRVIEYR